MDLMNENASGQHLNIESTHSQDVVLAQFSLCVYKTDKENIQSFITSLIHSFPKQRIEQIKVSCCIVWGSSS